jgi:hypothetical protein
MVISLQLQVLDYEGWNPDPSEKIPDSERDPNPEVCQMHENTFMQCCGSDSEWSAFIWLSWIRILIGNADPDPDPGAWKLIKKKKKNIPGFLPFKEIKCL